MVNTKENHIAYFIAINKGPVAESSMLTNQISVSDKHLPPYATRNLCFNVFFHPLYIALSPMLLLRRLSLLYKMPSNTISLRHKGHPPRLSFCSEGSNVKIGVVLHFIRNRDLLHSRLQNLKRFLWLSKLEPRDFILTQDPDRVYSSHFFQ